MVLFYHVHTLPISILMKTGIKATSTKIMASHQVRPPKSYRVPPSQNISHVNPDQSWLSKIHAQAWSNQAFIFRSMLLALVFRNPRPLHPIPLWSSQFRTFCLTAYKLLVLLLKVVCLRFINLCSLNSNVSPHSRLLHYFGVALVAIFDLFCPVGHSKVAECVCPSKSTLTRFFFRLSKEIWHMSMNVNSVKPNWTNLNGRLLPLTMAFALPILELSLRLLSGCLHRLPLVVPLASSPWAVS
jgi:hypothetical protein